MRPLRPPGQPGALRRIAPACPGCGRPLERVAAPAGPVHRCGGCRGLWVDRATFERLAVPPEGPPPGSRRARGPEDEVRYRRCPACDDVMGRTNFARVSGVIVDVCRAHGAFLDEGELSRIRTFLTEGGVRRHAVARELAGQRERARARRRPPAAIEPVGSGEPDPLSVEGLLGLLADLVWP